MALTDELRAKIRKKIRLCIAQSLFSLAKITITVVLLALSPGECDLPLEKWLSMMIVQDTVQLMVNAIECQQRSSRLDSPSPEFLLDESSESAFFNPEDIFSERSSQPCSTLLVLKELNKM